MSRSGKLPPAFSTYPKFVLICSMKGTWGQNLLHYYTSLQPLAHLPNAIQWLHPQQSGEVAGVMEQFFHKFFNDTQQRTLLLGINPGRFGAGITGVNFTAARQLADDCGMAHPFKPQSELSAEFIYEVIRQYGGPAVFYSKFFIGSVCPLGFVQHGKNLNYYDDKQLLAAVEPFIIEKVSQLVSFNVNKEVGFCIGGEKNFKHLHRLNEQYGWFQKIIALPHPRFIMQYRRKAKQEYVALYLKELERLSGD